MVIFGSGCPSLTQRRLWDLTDVPPPSRSTCRPRCNLQFHPARGKSLIIVLQDKNEALPTGWMKKRQFWSTLSEGVELMTETQNRVELLSPELVKFSSLKNLPILSNHRNFRQNWWQKKHKIWWNYCHQNWWHFRHSKTHQFLQFTEIFAKIGDKKSTKFCGIIVTRIGDIFVT